MSELLTRAFGRLGPSYPEAAVFLALQVQLVVTLLAIAGLALFVEMTGGEFLRLLLVATGLLVVYNGSHLPMTRRLLTPVRSWLEGERDREATVAAWRAGASLPWELFRREFLTVAPGLIGWAFLALWCVYATWELGLPAYTAPLLIAGVLVYSAYALTLRFLGTERVLRPVLLEIASQVTDERGLETPGVPVRWRLLAALPAINVITGVFVAAVVHGGRNGLGELAIAVLVSAAVASTISLAVTLLLAGSISTPLDALEEATRRVGEGDFGARVPVVTTDETGALARSFNQMAAGLEERERIRDAFGTYVDREVAEHILREGTNLAGEEVEVTMMFIDIRNFTGYAESSPASDVVATLNRLFERVVPVIHEHRGHVDKFVGDGLLAVFGAPRRQRDHADHALEAALEIEAAVEEEFGGELAIGAGLNSGIVVAGNVGGAGRLEFSVIGDAVNVAARVEAATRQTGDVILISEQTRRLLTDSARLQARPEIPLKGKQQRVGLFAPRTEAGVREV